VFEPLADRSIELADGRQLAFAEWGDLDGPVVLFFHGTPHSRLWCPDIAATRTAGVHLVTVDRPGYGRSDPPPADLSMRGWTDDVSQLADALRADRVGVVGWSGGALSATACAAVIPDRLSGAGEIGGAGWPVDEQPGVLESLEEADQRTYQVARTDRTEAMRLAEELAADWITEYQNRPEASMDDHTVPQDMRYFEDPAWAANFYEAVRESVRQGPCGYAWEAVAGLSSWGFALEDITMRFHLWHGAHDSIEQLASVEYWASRIPGAEVTVWDESGHFAVVDHWSEMLVAVAGDRF
jgi:pimeloyl-ACP methyl ester carboxylesterase